MKKIKSLSVIFIAMAITCISFTNCESLGEDTTSEVCNLDNAYDSYINAINAFSNNPTRANCNNMKSKANAYITAAGNCSGVDVSGPKATINSIDCTDF
jgi:hypothetical protein